MAAVDSDRKSARVTLPSYPNQISTLSTQKLKKSRVVIAGLDNTKKITVACMGEE